MERISYKRIGHNGIYLYEARQGEKTLQVSIVPEENIKIEIIFNNKEDETASWEDISYTEMKKGASIALTYIEKFFGEHLEESSNYFWNDEKV